MDGQRRVARPVRGLLARGERFANRIGVRVATRLFGIGFVASALVLGGVQGGAFTDPNSPANNLSGRVAGLFGMAADDIQINGLSHHDPAVVLAQIGVKPGASLVGFDAEEARILLESMDWVSAAEVRRSFPNQLAINLQEREPFAIWQMDGQYAVIDKAGTSMSGLNPLTLRGLPLVVGKGANLAAADYVNQLEAIPTLKQKVQAAARMGERRWTLFLDNGVTIALPEQGQEAALKQVAELDAEQNILSKGIQGIDFRSPDRIVIALAEPKEASNGEALKVTQKAPQ
jgi:cell division protein FtsQ